MNISHLCTVHTLYTFRRNNCPVNHINCDGKTGLFIAAEKGRTSIIPILLSFGASIDMSCCPSNRTPLMAASELGHVTAILELINNGASFHCTDVKRNSALELALRNRRDSAAALLILRETPYSDYVHEFIRSQEYPLCKVVKQKLVQSVAALLDRMVIPEAGNTSQVKVTHFRYTMCYILVYLYLVRYCCSIWTLTYPTNSQATADFSTQSLIS